MTNSVGSISFVSNLDGLTTSGTTLATQTAQPGTASAAAAAPDFATVLAGAASNAVSTMKSAEAMSIAGITGKASVQQVVEAVMNAQETLQAAVAIRDKAVAAYQEVARMSI